MFKNYSVKKIVRFLAIPISLTLLSTVSLAASNPLTVTNETPFPYLVGVSYAPLQEELQPNKTIVFPIIKQVDCKDKVQITVDDKEKTYTIDIPVEWTEQGCYLAPFDQQTVIPNQLTISVDSLNSSVVFNSPK